MIRKKFQKKQDKKAHPLIGGLLFAISVILLIFTAPIGFLYGVLHTFFKSGIRGIGEYLLKIAVSIDQLGNVIMQHLVNVLWIKKGGYKFGNRDETISSALGKNKKLGTLTGFGSLIDKILDGIDPDHSLNSIDYYIEPTNGIRDEVAWLYLKDRSLLCIRVAGSQYRIPGAERNPEESERETLFRAVKETLGVELDIANLRPEKVFQMESVASNTLVRKACFRGNFSGSLGKSSHMREIAWLGYADRDALSEIDQMVFNYLFENGELS